MMRKILLQEYDKKFPLVCAKRVGLQGVCENNEEALAELVELEAIRNGFVDLQIDHRTGVLVPRSWFDRFENSILPQALPGLRDCKDKGIISREDVVKLRPKKVLSIIFGDMAYLNYLNSLSHDEGDLVLEKLGNILNSTAYGAARPAWSRLGDEFFAFDLCNSETMERLGVMIAKNFSLQTISSLKEKNLHPRIDFGVASLSEAWSFLKEYFEKNQEINQVTFKDFTAKIFIGLADKRSAIRKCFAQIDLLTELLWDSQFGGRKYPEGLFDQMYVYLAKGAMKISKDKLDFLVDPKAQSKKDYYQEILSFVKDKAQEEKDPQRSLIFQTALAPFYKDTTKACVS
jgi:GGDEF domain-containing protein